MTKVLLIGNGAREHAIAEAIKRSGCDPRLYSYMKTNNPGIASLSHDLRLGNYDDLAAICTFAKDAGIEFAIIGPEDPLQNGVVDALSEAGFPSVGPTRSLARLETSKIFTRRLLEKYSIPGNPRFKVFDTPHAILDFLKTLEEGSVIKPDGLTGGKGVMVQGDHFSTPEEALLLCETILKTGAPVLVEERLDGEEFSLQCFCDGKTVVATPAVQDHKRRFEGDSGPNTGGMGSYSYPDRSLPFLIPSDIEDGVEITRKISEALFKETGELYKGIMYGGFMATKEGVKLLEYNARFGDPEAMNVLPLIKSDFIEVCRAISKVH
ncbi:MAG: phosphoribosylamine--glycine ligase [Syntrophales bacterium]|nr:phosphoribosylamine--glycine ligase [Syntrophales bacterium]